jgi:hypothetical protein
MVNRKRIISIVLMVFMFLSINFAGIDLSRLNKNYKSYTVAYAAGPRSSTSGFKSGSFKSFGGSGSGGFKSGSFFSSKGSSSYKGSSWSWSTPRYTGRSTWIPFSFGRGINFGFSPLYFLFGSLGSIIRLIIIVAVIYAIVKSFRRRR